MTSTHDESSQAEWLEPKANPDSDTAPTQWKASRGWKIVGVVSGVILAVGGLAVIGFLVMLAIALSQWGSSGGK